MSLTWQFQKPVWRLLSSVKQKAGKPPLWQMWKMSQPMPSPRLCSWTVLQILESIWSHWKCCTTITCYGSFWSPVFEITFKNFLLKRQVPSYAGIRDSVHISRTISIHFNKLRKTLFSPALFLPVDVCRQVLFWFLTCFRVLTLSATPSQCTPL